MKELRPEELTECKSCTGSSQCLTGSTRPDGAAGVSLGQVSKPTAEDLKNAMDLIETLTTEYNKARQAKITNELIEIISGAEAV